MKADRKTENPGKKRAKFPGMARILRRIRQFVEQDIWEIGGSEQPALKNHWVSLMRILVISWQGLSENRLFSRAASLSYSTLIALGPLVAIVVIFSSSFVQTDPELQIKRALLFISPSLQELITLEAKGGDPEMATALDTLLTQIVEGAEGLLSQVNTSGSTAFGALGAVIFIWVIIQLLTSVETTLNQIWGVHQGRPWSQRIVFYWTFVSLGALLGLGSTALFSASNLAGMMDWMPFGETMSGLVLTLTPVLSFAMLVFLLALFYRFFPNTNVQFKAALVGSLLTALLLFINNYLSILYVHRVISFQSLYGSVGIVPVLMLGLYFFWVLILLGGQLTYGVQNVHFLATRTAWKRLSPLARELVALASFIMIARRFHDCEPAPTSTQISERLHVPVNILNESLEALERLSYITRVPLSDCSEESERTGYHPARPLSAYTLAQFKEAIERVGHSGLVKGLLKTDPLLQEYHAALQWRADDPLGQANLDSLFARDREEAQQP
jgi:membrane protein